MRLRMSVLFLVIISSIGSYGQDQNITDTLKADRFLDQGLKATRVTNQFDSAIYYFTEAAAIYENHKLWSKYVQCQNGLAETYLFSYQIGPGVNAAKKAVTESKAKLGENKLEEAVGNDLIGISYYLRSQYDTALIFMNKALTIKESILPELDYDLGSSYLKIAATHLLGADYDASLEYHNKALKVFEISGEANRGLANIYNNIAIIFQNKGRYEDALGYHRKSLDTKRKLYGQAHIDITESLSNMGQVHVSLNDYDEALELLQQSLAMQLKFYQPTHPLVADSYTEMGNVFRMKKDFGQALKYYRKSLSIIQKAYEEEGVEIGEAYINIAALYKAQSNFPEALAYYDKAMKVYSKVFGVKHIAIANIWTRLGEIRFAQGEYELALSLYQKALVAHVAGFDKVELQSNPPGNNYVAPSAILNTLYRKAEVLRKLYSIKNDTSFLNFAHQVYKTSDTIIAKTRQSFRSHNDKLALGDISHQLYSEAIKNSLHLFQVSDEKKYLHSAFYFSEKSKSEVLREGLHSGNAKHFAGLPDSLLNLEKAYLREINFTQSQMRQSKQQGNAEGTEKKATLENRLFALNQSYDSLIIALEEEYPDYYQLKYNNETVTIEQLQQKLPKKTGLIEYFWGDDMVYAFVITAEQLEVVSISKDTLFDQQITQLRVNLEGPGNSEKDFRMFAESAFAVFQKVLQQPLNYFTEDINQLIIIPDGPLGYIPFEALIQKPSAGGRVGYHRLAYVLQDYKISYGYNSTLIYSDLGRSISNDGPASYIAFAPVYENIDSSLSEGLGRFRDDLSSLQWNQPEVARIGDYLNGNAFIGQEALESRFKQEAGGYSILHLAMHAFVDNEDPMNSKLVFYQSTDTSDEDGLLHTFELYNMELQAKLAVLSACNTGYGKLVKGEGIISLARAFTYSGVPSVVMSQWQVDDEATSQLMDHFYQNLADGLSKDEALQLAKLTFLKEADPVKADPFYWGSFVVIGDVAPIQSSPKLWPFAIVISVLAIAIGIVFHRRRKR